MSQHSVTKCDYCGVTKGEGNHWLKGANVHGGYLIADSHSLNVSTMPENTFVEDLCSEMCALTRQAQVLRKGALVETIAREPIMPIKEVTD